MYAKFEKICAAMTPPGAVKPWQLACLRAYPLVSAPEAKRSFAQSPFGYFSFKSRDNMAGVWLPVCFRACPSVFAQKQSAALHKVLLPPFLSRKGGYQAATEPSQRGSVPAASRPLSVRQMICPRPMPTFRLAISTSWPISSRPKATWAGTSRSS